MDTLKRLCPQCGKANPLEKTYCEVCGARIETSLSLPVSRNLSLPGKEIGASLAVGAGVLAVRAGLRLVQHLLERNAPTSLGPGSGSSLLARIAHRVSQWAASEEPPSPAPDVRFWGRRVHAHWRSDGTRHLEVEEVTWETGKGDR
jgi:hypothetical protein